MVHSLSKPHPAVHFKGLSRELPKGQKTWPCLVPQHSSLCIIFSVMGVHYWLHNTAELHAAKASLWHCWRKAVKNTILPCHDLHCPTADLSIFSCHNKTRKTESFTHPLTLLCISTFLSKTSNGQTLAWLVTRKASFSCHEELADQALILLFPSSLNPCIFQKTVKTQNNLNLALLSLSFHPLEPVFHKPSHSTNQ